MSETASIEKSKDIIKDEIDLFSKVIVHPSFNKTIEEINRLNIRLPKNPTSEDMDFTLFPYPQEGKLISNIEEIKNYDLNPKKGETLAKEMTLAAYDDSPKIRELFKFARIHRFKLQYGMNNKSLKGKELIITNYELPSDLVKD